MTIGSSPEIYCPYHCSLVKTCDTQHLPGDLSCFIITDMILVILPSSHSSRYVTLLVHDLESPKECAGIAWDPIIHPWKEITCGSTFQKSRASWSKFWWWYLLSEWQYQNHVHGSHHRACCVVLSGVSVEWKYLHYIMANILRGRMGAWNFKTNYLLIKKACIGIHKTA